MMNLHEIVTIDLENLPAKRSPFSIQRFFLLDSFRRVIGLDAVSVDNYGNVRKSEMAGGHGRLPDLAFVTLTVPGESKDPVALPVQPCGKSHSIGNRQALA
jgi:hypothetical protein